MAALSNSKKIESVTIAVAGVLSNVFDMTNLKSAALQLHKTGAGTGTAKLQWSNDQTTWQDVPTAQFPGASQVVGAGAVEIYLYAQDIPFGFVKVTYTGAVDTSTFTGFWLGKVY